MSSEQRWMTNEAVGLLLQLSRLCCLAPVRFVEISSDTFVYTSRPLLFFSIIVAATIKICLAYFLYSAIYSTTRNYRHLNWGVFHVGVIVLFVGYAVLHSETRIKNYMTCFTKLNKAVRKLQSTEEYYVKTWHVLIVFLTFTGGNTLTMFFTAFAYNGSIDPLTSILVLELIMSVAVQLQFLYFSLYVSFVLRIITHTLQEELSTIIKNGESLGNRFTSDSYNIPIESINKAIDMIGMTDQSRPDVLTTQRQEIAQRIQQISDCYVLACQVLRELSSSDDFLLFLLIITFSFHLVFSSYDIIILFYKVSTYVPSKLIVQSLEIFLLAIRLTMVVEPCHVTHQTILNVRCLVSEIMCYVITKNDPVCKVMEGFYHQLVLNDISYTALGIFKIGRPLVTSILGVAITVLIAIFQF